MDFEYNGYKWSFPGLGSYSIASIMEQIGVTGEIGDVSLECIEGEQIPDALYLEEKEDGWYLTSDCAFDEVYELKVVVEGVTYVISVTDDAEEAWSVTVNLLDYDGVSPASSEEMSVIRNKKFCVLAVVTDKDNGDIVGYRPGGFRVDDGTGSTISVTNLGLRYKTVHLDENKNVVEEYQNADFDPTTQNISFRLYEGNIDPD